jgi:hypothetical protein
MPFDEEPQYSDVVCHGYTTHIAGCRDFGKNAICVRNPWKV